MTLSEIETTLEELTKRHPNLDTTLLSTLLSSSGWEEKTIKEAIVLFNQKGKKEPSPSPVQVIEVPLLTPTEALVTTPLVIPPENKIPEVITFYQTDGTEEGELHAFADVETKNKEVPRKVPQVVVINSEPKQETKEIEKPPELDALEVKVIDEVPPIEIPQTSEEVVVTPASIVTPQVAPQVIAVPVEPVSLVKEPESLIVHEELPEKRESATVATIPDNLPLLPFDSSPHIWSFSKYKDIFHSSNPPKEEIQVITVMPQEKTEAQPSIQTLPEEKPKVRVVLADEEVILETVPYSKGDESLVFLAGMMLLVIILILGYMYSNGRL